MKIKIGAVASCFLISQAMLTPFPRASCSESFPKIVTLEEKTPIELRLTESCSSQNAAVGQTLELETTMDVIVDGEIVIKKGSQVIGRVLKAKPSGFYGQTGELTFSIEYVMSVDGQRIPFT